MFLIQKNRCEKVKTKNQFKFVQSQFLEIFKLTSNQFQTQPFWFIWSFN